MCLFTDLSKEFDTIWKTGLLVLVQLLRYEISCIFYSIIEAMYKEVQCCVKTINVGFSLYFLKLDLIDDIMFISKSQAGLQTFKRNFMNIVISGS